MVRPVIPDKINSDRPEVQNISGRSASPMSTVPQPSKSPNPQILPRTAFSPNPIIPPQTSQFLQTPPTQSLPQLPSTNTPVGTLKPLTPASALNAKMQQPVGPSMAGTQTLPKPAPSMVGTQTLTKSLSLPPNHQTLTKLHSSSQPLISLLNPAQAVPASHPGTNHLDGTSQTPTAFQIQMSTLPTLPNKPSGLALSSPTSNSPRGNLLRRPQSPTDPSEDQPTSPTPFSLAHSTPSLRGSNPRQPPAIKPFSVTPNQSTDESDKRDNLRRAYTTSDLTAPLAGQGLRFQGLRKDPDTNIPSSGGSSRQKTTLPSTPSTSLFNPTAAVQGIWQLGQMKTPDSGASSLAFGTQTRPQFTADTFKPTYVPLRAAPLNPEKGISPLPPHIAEKHNQTSTIILPKVNPTPIEPEPKEEQKKIQPKGKLRYIARGTRVYFL